VNHLLVRSLAPARCSGSKLGWRAPMSSRSDAAGRE
jgi:hypothetical protein